MKRYFILAGLITLFMGCKAETPGTDPGKIDTAEENKGNGLRVDVFYNRKTDKAYCRLYEYIPYRYEPCSPVYEYKASQVENLLK